jgi:hypothetical protein
MPWYRTREGYYRYAKPNTSRKALYDHRGYTNLGEEPPGDLLQDDAKALPFDVNQHNVDDCLDYARQHPRQITELIVAEKAGQVSTIL